METHQGILGILRAPDAQNNIPAHPQRVTFQSRKVWEWVPQNTVQFLFTEKKVKLTKKTHLFSQWLWPKSQTVKMTQPQRLKKLHLFPDLQETMLILKTKLDCQHKHTEMWLYNSEITVKSSWLIFKEMLWTIFNQKWNCTITPQSRNTGGILNVIATSVRLYCFSTISQVNCGLWQFTRRRKCCLHDLNKWMFFAQH